MRSDWLQSWLADMIKRKHSAAQITLSHHNIYIVPSRQGAFFLCMVILNFILGSNYQNNLILGVAYIMLLILVLALIYGYLNLHGLTIQVLDIKNNFASKPVEVLIKLSAPHDCYSLDIASQEYDFSPSNNNYQQGATVSSLFLHPEQRGRYQLGRIKLSSRYPFGLVRVWTYLNVDRTFCTYPTPLTCQLTFSTQEANESQGQYLHQSTQSHENFDGLERFRPGISKSRISWRHFAKNQQLLVKQYSGDSYYSQHTFDYAAHDGNKEARLSKLCYQILEADKQGDVFALRLSNAVQLGVDRGDKHREMCLEALSDF
ncbi:hypothetical protein CWB99_02960 [Pseudoalteromonas rubra]|uniref:DUF58 domain-containing protein n=2 Tax=Pseudoalteromonas rubra TaxID=43658 RepID=A0A5S3WSA2_9GAMM|nr:hypothetical protein CWC00_17525 [Pseudoalteromonas rubra]TMP31937.1 hypothetical protein CWB99_02960 [Pseudoalteromonas rubra]